MSEDLLGDSTATEEILEEEEILDEGHNSFEAPERNSHFEEVLEESTPQQQAYNPKPSKEEAVVNDKVLEWQEKHRQYLAEKAAKSKERHQKALEEAKQTIQQFYQQRAANLEKVRSTNRQKQDSEGGTEELHTGNDWQTIASLVDFSRPTAQKDTSRIREIIIKLKH
eukprot:TRINITY_DN5312_c0_g1_i1.p1 TRINITY_DN5312_c0_g1~~TRINITY_DN5312_c0_g1_i1.p1  ORF type:complete len:168 (-),score=67.72 TRINITY_DN5312_c0_g1_i1:29-532(-)